MVTPIYTAPLKASYTRIQGGAAGSTRPNNGISTDDNAEKDLTQQSNGLAALDEQAKTGTISIQSIVTDFQNTMEALGVTPEVRSAVSPYLQVVAHQAGRTQPAPGLMKQNLKAAADTMDQFITEALGQNSRVVREWVDALLMQPIDYKSEAPIALSGSDLAATSRPSQTAKPVDMTTLKTQITEAQNALETKNPQGALEVLEPALASLEGANAPKAKGRVLFLLGQAYSQTGQTEQAQSAYQQALGTLGNDAVPMQIKAHYALAQLAQKQGDLNAAESSLQQVQKLAQQENNLPWQGQAFNQLGEVALKQGKMPQAAQYWLNGVDVVEGSNSKLEATLYTQLGQVAKLMGQPKDALGFYRQAYGIAEKREDAAGQNSALQKMASLYLDAGKVDKAKQILAKIQPA